MRSNRTAAGFGIAATAMLLAVLGFALLQGGVMFAGAATNTITGTVNVPLTCALDISNTAISFGTVLPGSSAPTTNVIVLSDTIGNTNANAVVYGGNWIGSPSGTMGVSNTLWAKTSGGPGTALGYTTGVDTGIVVPTGASTNDIYFGLNVPAGQTAAVYTQTITLEVTC